MKFYVLHSRNKFQEVNAYCLDDVVRWSYLYFGFRHLRITDRRDSTLMQGRQFSGMSELYEWGGRAK